MPSAMKWLHSWHFPLQGTFLFVALGPSLTLTCISFFIPGTNSFPNGVVMGMLKCSSSLFINEMKANTVEEGGVLNAKEIAVESRPYASEKYSISIKDRGGYT